MTPPSPTPEHKRRILPSGFRVHIGGLLKGVRNRAQFCLFLVSLLLSPESLIAQNVNCAAPDVKLDFRLTAPVPGTSGTSAKFTAIPGGAVPPAAVPNLLSHTLSDNHAYVVLVDSKSYRRAYNRFEFDVYLRANLQNQNSPLYRFLVWEESIGTFPDSLADAEANISGPAGLDTVVLELPQHSDDSPNLQIPGLDKPYPVSMGSDSSMTLGIKNNLSNLHVLLSTADPEIRVTSNKCPACWAKLSARIMHSRLAPGSGTSLFVDLQPNMRESFKLNFLTTSADEAQDSLTVTVSSQSEFEGADVSQDFSVPIQFEPPWYGLFLSILLGASFGVLMRFLLARQQGKRFDWMEGLFQFLLAWVLVFVLYVTKTEATLFGHKLGPTALIPAGLIALLAAGGLPVGERIAEVMRKQS
jgi:hypothetical protein